MRVVPRHALPTTDDAAFVAALRQLDGHRSVPLVLVEVFSRLLALLLVLAVSVGLVVCTAMAMHLPWRQLPDLLR